MSKLIPSAEYTPDTVCLKAYNLHLLEEMSSKLDNVTVPQSFVIPYPIAQKIAKDFQRDKYDEKSFLKYSLWHTL